MNLLDSRDNLTHYGFTCGYVEAKIASNGETSIMWESCCYVIRVRDTEGRTRAQTARTLRSARKLAAMMLKETQ